MRITLSILYQVGRDGVIIAIEVHNIDITGM